MYAGTDITISRPCSADMPLPTALYNSVTMKGTRERFHFTGEEDTNGNAYAIAVTGANAGDITELPLLGTARFENIVLCPYEQDVTIAMGTDDTNPGYIFMNVGQKNSDGSSELDKAGLLNGVRYVLKVCVRIIPADHRRICFYLRTDPEVVTHNYKNKLLTASTFPLSPSITI
mgnify:CR=1 FL=1|tara:strand:- start:17 stop:538 length:522 start_codon:yes stop_codon:yes gene_type:complete